MRCSVVAFTFACAVSCAARAETLKVILGDCVAGVAAPQSIPRCSEVIASSKDPRVLEHAYNTRGLAELGQSQFAPAIDDFSQVIRLDPKIAGYFDNRQNAYKGASRLAEALADADTAVRMAPSYAFVFHSRANVYAAMGRFDQARTDFNQAMTLSPDDAGLYFDRGKMLLLAADPDGAAADFTHSLAIRASAAAYRERGLIYKSAGLLDRARDDLRAAQALAPDDAIVLDALRNLGVETAASPHS